MPEQVTCSYCGSEHCKPYKHYTTLQNGSRLLFQCPACQKIFSETKGTFLEGLRRPISFIARVLKTRTEGMGFNATCRALDVAKNTLLLWERRLASTKHTLLLYALMHTFLSQVIEGDEIYTKIGKNVPVEDCEGWTIVLMERASRFIWTMQCGKKDRKLFYNAIQLLRNVIERSSDVTLVTDGERRYGNLLFDICHEVVHNGKRGRPRRVLRRQVKVRLKNKGKRAQQAGQPRPKYEAPHPEHPDTCQNITPNEIQANRLEATNASIRRRDSTYRRKTNTYAKSTTGLQRTLDIFWIAHNFIRKHFTTKKVPAVAIGIMQQGLSWQDVFRLRTSLGNPLLAL
jgi:transposase-like protein